MIPISTKFQKHKALIPYITAGDPNLDTTEKLIYELEKAGADIIELGIPFSDSLADGPTIVESHMRALASKTTLKKVFALVYKARKQSSVPIVFMLSYNLIYQFGIDKFISEVKRCEVSGYIIPDLPPEETPKNLKPIYLVTPTTTLDRIKTIVNKSTNFVYLVSSTGVTGARTTLPEELTNLIKKVSAISTLPVAVGFGISSTKQAKEISKVADGVIVGSALVKHLSNNLQDGLKFIKELRKALNE